MTLKNPTATNSDLINHYFPKDGKLGEEERKVFCNTKAYQHYQELCQEPHGKAQPCGGDTVGKIYRALKKFFIVLRGLKKYLDKYVNQTINAIQNLQSEIQATITEIVAVLKTINFVS